jgi:hypothetical protein
MKSNSNKNIINYTLIKNQPADVKLLNIKDEYLSPIDYINKKKDTTNNILKKRNTKKKSLIINTNITTNPTIEEKNAPLISENLTELKEKLRKIKQRNVNREIEEEKMAKNLSNIFGDTHKVTFFDCKKLDSIYTMTKFTRNAFQKSSTDFDLNQIKKNLELHNRNMEGNRLKEHLKSVTLHGMKVKSKLKTNSNYVKEILTLTDEDFFNTMNSNLPTMAQTGECFNTEEKYVDKFENENNNIFNENFNNKNNIQTQSDKFRYSKTIVFKHPKENIPKNIPLNQIPAIDTEMAAELSRRKKRFSTINKNIEKLKFDIHYHTGNNFGVSKFKFNDDNSHSSIDTFIDKLTEKYQTKYTGNKTGSNFNPNYKRKMSLINRHDENVKNIKSSMGREKIINKNKETKIKNFEKINMCDFDLSCRNTNTQIGFMRKGGMRNIKTELKSEEEFDREYANEYKKILKNLDKMKKSKL